MNDFVPLASMITILIYNQVAPAHLIMVLISNNDNLQPSGPCSHGTETVTNLQPSDPSAHDTPKTRTANLQLSGPCAHGTETIITNLHPK